MSGLMVSETGSRVVLPPALMDQVRASLAESDDPVTPARVAQAVREAGGVLGDQAVLAVVEELRAEITGAGPLDALLQQTGVTDVLVNGPHDVWLDRGSGLERTGVRFRDEAAVRRLATRLAARGGRRLDDAVPYVDARLPGGARLHAIIPPVSPAGTVISLRVPARVSFGLEDLVACGSVPDVVAAWLRALIAARVAFLVTGGTGTGKTTVLGALLSLVDPAERLLLVEDSAELQVNHPHVVRLESRPVNVEGAGGIGLNVLVRQSLRMRPDRVVVGEVRGAEVVDLLAALNTGHDGGCGTLHANSARDVPARLEALGVAAGLTRDAVHAQAAAALHVIIHLTRRSDGLRRVAALALVRRSAGEGLVVHPALHVDPDGKVHEQDGAASLEQLLLADGGPG